MKRLRSSLLSLAIAMTVTANAAEPGITLPENPAVEHSEGFGIANDFSFDDAVAQQYAEDRAEELQVAARDSRRPGGEKSSPQDDIPPAKQVDPNAQVDLPPVAVPDPNLPGEFIAIPDRWRIVEAIGVNERTYDPYNQNTLKGDRPIHDDWFFILNLISDTIYEPRRIPTPVSPATTRSPGQLDVLGGRNQFLFNENFIIGLIYLKGDTAFRPPDHEFRLTGVFNYNYTKVQEDRFINIDPDDGERRTDKHFGVQELFYDVHLRNVGDRYDFDSFRVGIQPFSTDFRGFLFQDNQFGIRLFGNRDNNFFQYNLAWFRRVEKDINSGLNDIGEGLRDDDIFVGNVYRQDFPVVGFVSQATLVYNRNREGDERFFDQNGFLQRPAPLGFSRPHDYDVYYLGYNGDGHFGRLNLTASYYYATGEDERGPFSGRSERIDAHFLAAEASVDFDWIRLRVSGLYASGDDDPFDRKAEGFDAIFENPIFAGADTSFFIRQGVPNIGGGAVALSGRNAVLNSLRTSKEQGQSNFTNPGTTLLGIGADFDVTPEFRISVNANKIGFADTTSLEVARQLGSVDNDLGWDLSVATIYRPFFTQNVVFRLSGAVLLPGEGFEDLYGDEEAYSILANLILTY